MNKFHIQIRNTLEELKQSRIVSSRDLTHILLHFSSVVVDLAVARPVAGSYLCGEVVIEVIMIRRI